MRTIDRTDHEVAAQERRGNNAWLFGAIAMLALLIGVVAGWQIFASEVEVMKPGGEELTVREQQMVDLAEDYRQAWVDADGAAVESFFVPGGFVEVRGVEYRVDDGSLERYVNSAATWQIEIEDPTLVHGDELLFFHDYDGTVLASMMTFTRAGDLLVISHVMQ